MPHSIQLTQTQCTRKTNNICLNNLCKAMILNLVKGNVRYTTIQYGQNHYELKYNMNCKFVIKRGNSEVQVKCNAYEIKSKRFNIIM